MRKHGGYPMRRVVQLCLLAVVSAGGTGCFWNQYSSDPIRRYQQLYHESQNLRLIEDDIERFWMLDQPSQLSLRRYNGFGAPEARSYRISRQDKGGFETR